MATLLKIYGTVQGVGFRPTAYRIACEARLRGYVANTIGGVAIGLWASREEIDAFMSRLRAELPPIARIDAVVEHELYGPAPQSFTIAYSNSAPQRSTNVSPDVAICQECLADTYRHPRRIGYPLTNCTNCGPRFSIIRALPYDRPNTAMAPYEMCPDCRSEYVNPFDRRFHAQPIACNFCGPHYQMGQSAKYDDILNQAQEILRHDGLLMVKGIGGYNLLAMATSHKAIERLRTLKHRPRKPFAVMVASLAEAQRLVELTEAEAATLTSWRAPIVIAKVKEDVLLSCQRWLCEVSGGLRTLGVMLPHMAFQHHLLRRIKEPIVVTSANRHGEPMITYDDDALDYAASYDLPCITYPREIVNRVDDSVVRHIGTTPQLLRRSRGYVPDALRVDVDVEGVVALGADITSAWAFGRGDDIVLSPYIGSLLSADTSPLEASIKSLTQLFRVAPRRVIVDAHPGYSSADLGRRLAREWGVEVVEVYHHHAHALSVMAEYGLHGPLLALVLDGTGAGPDGTIWGAELLRCTRSDFQRLAHGPYHPLPGGDKASLEPWRMAAATLYSLDGNLMRLPAPLRQAIGNERIDVLEQMLARGVRCPLSTGAGRVWDAMAALLGLCYQQGYDAEAPTLLESAAIGYEAIDPYELDNDHPLSLRPIINGVLADLEAGVETGVISARFHDAYARGWLTTVVEAAKREDVKDIVLSGGVMQNVRLSSSIVEGLRRAGLRPYLPFKAPCNDGGIALGQMYFRGIEG